MAVTTLYATQGGGTSYFDADNTHVFLTVPPNSLFEIGYVVPMLWDYQPIGLISVGDVESMHPTERDGYEAGYANKGDPNPFVPGVHHDLYQAGRDRGDRERLALDE